MSYRVKIILLMQFCVSIFMICVSYFLDRKAKIISRLLKIERYSEIIYNSENKTFDADGKLLSLVKTKILYQIFKMKIDTIVIIKRSNLLCKRREWRTGSKWRANY